MSTETTKAGAPATAATRADPARPTAPPPPPEIKTTPVSVPIEGKADLKFDVADDADGDVYFSLSVRKSGSTMLHKIVNALARRNGVNSVDVPGTFFRHGMRVADWVKADLQEILKPGNIYIGYRSFPTNMAGYPLFQSAKKILMFRDPRDALVSQYFSDAYSHSLPSRDTETGRKAAEAFEKKREEVRATSIDDYVVKNAKAIETTLLAYAAMLKDPTCLCLRYEDYVFQKKRLIYKILQHFEWSCPPGIIEGLLKHIDEIPEVEDTARFVRRVIPGDHRNKLKPEAIRRLNNQLKESMRVFDYY
jgi:hypothetical protein